MSNKAIISSALSFTLLSGALLFSTSSYADTSDIVDVTVNVPAICMLSATNKHLVKTINPGTHEEIGIAKLKAICNDFNGFALYSVAYTDDVYGNKYLTTDIGDEYKIDTGTATSGVTSNWNVTIDNDDDVEGNVEADIENSFDSPHVIPAEYTKIASVNTTTDNIFGTNLTATFHAYISAKQAAGTYTGKVKFLLIHPNILDGSTTPPTTQADTIKTMQSVALWGGSVTEGQTVEAIDERDGEVYTVARLADGNLWMTKNLRLDFTKASITAENTNNPTAEFLARVNAAEKPAPFNTHDWSDVAADEIVVYNTINIGDFTLDSAGHTYDEYGVHYKWITATAGNGTMELPVATPAPGDICPSGWRLPTGGTSGEYYALNELINDGSTSTAAPWFSSPVNLVYSDNFMSSYSYENPPRGYMASMWTSTKQYQGGAVHVLRASNYPGGEYFTANDNALLDASCGSPVRCIAKTE